MNLVIDIGNSSAKFGLFSGTDLLEHGLGHEGLEKLLLQHGSAISPVLISSVAAGRVIIDLLRKFNIPFSFLGAQTLLPVKITYKTPDTLGSDRIALAVAAERLFGGAPALSIAAGSCITYNFTKDGSFEGGAISPGITMRFQAMNQFTARLPYVDWSDYRHNRFTLLTGHDSEASMLCGVLNGVLHEIEGTIEQYRLRYSDLRVALTGGDSGFLVKNLKNAIFARPDMVLEGLNHILLHHA